MKIRFTDKATEEDRKLCNENGKNLCHFKIYDYKTGSQAKLSEGYKNQLILYVYLLSQKYFIPEDEITSRFDCYLYYPLTKSVRDLNISDTKKVEEITYKNMLHYIFDDNEYINTLNKFKNIIKDTSLRDWNSLDPLIDGSMSYSCSYCQFCGHPKYCTLTYKAGMTFPHSAKVQTKQNTH